MNANLKGGRIFCLPLAYRIRKATLYASFLMQNSRKFSLYFCDCLSTVYK